MSWRHWLRESIQDVPSHESEHPRIDRDLVRMDLNEAPLQPDVSEMVVFERELTKLDLNRYPEASGRALRERLAESWGVTADQILLGNGSVETIGILMTTFGGHRHGVPP